MGLVRVDRETLDSLREYSLKQQQQTGRKPPLGQLVRNAWKVYGKKDRFSSLSDREAELLEEVLGLMRSKSRMKHALIGAIRKLCQSVGKKEPES